MTLSSDSSRKQQPSPQGLNLRVPHTGQIGCNGVAGDHQPGPLDHEGPRAEPVAPGLPGGGVRADRRVHASWLGADLGDGPADHLPAGGRLDRVPVNPGQPGDQGEVDAEVIGPGGPRRGGGQTAALGPAQPDEAGQPVESFAGSHRWRDSQLAELCGRGEDVGCGGADVKQGAAQVGAEHVRRDAGSDVLVAGAAAGDLPGGLALPWHVPEPVIGELAAEAVQQRERPRVPGALVGLPPGAGRAACDEPVEDLFVGDVG